LAKHPRISAVLALTLTALTLGACGHNPGGFGPTAQLSDRECMARAMFFESNRSSDDGMLAVGTVVMNRLDSPKYPKSVCGVVGQPNQFAEGALTKHVNKRHSSWARAERAADAVLAGERHAGVGRAMFFHTAGYSFPYRNMKYVTLAGGNIFYDKRNPQPGAPAWPSANSFARNFGKPAERSEPVMLAEADTAPRPEPRVAPEPSVVPAPRRPNPAPASEPLVLASARFTPPKPEAVILAARTPARSPQPAAVASVSPPSKRPSTFNPAQIASVLAKAPAEKSRPAQLPGLNPAPKPKPIVLAMADTKSRPAAISITDLIQRDVRKR
jgi:hypothetical protein